MAGPQATFISMTRLENLKIYRYSVEQVLASSDEANIEIAIPRKGNLKGFKITAPDSQEFDFALYQSHDSIAPPSLDPILAVLGVLTGYHFELFEPTIPYFNNDSPIQSLLYLYFNNKDKVHNSGEILIELTVQHASYLQHGNESAPVTV